MTSRNQAWLPRLVADPDPRNRRALHAYMKAGFHLIGERDTPWGLVTLLARDPPISGPGR